MIICNACGGPTERVEEAYQYFESGMDHVYLDGIAVRKCKECGEQLARVPQRDEVDTLLARLLTAKPTRLLPSEIEFLRTFIGVLSMDLAAYMGVSPSSMSRWESEYMPNQMSGPTERLLRLTAIMKLGDAGPDLSAVLTSFRDLSKETLPATKLTLRKTRRGWRKV